jgi:flagella basal body P-ring formation protein FlgA
MPRNIPPPVAALLLAGLAFAPPPAGSASAQGVAPASAAGRAATSANAEVLQDLTVVARVAQAFALDALSHKSRSKAVGTTDVVATPVDPRLRLPVCARLAAFLPAGRTLAGRTTVGVRCDAPVAWRVYVQVAIGGDGPSGASTLGSAESVAQDSTVGRRAPPPAPPRAEPVVSAGQSVRVEVRGAGFSVGAEGKALGSAAPGQTVRVRIANGRVIAGIAQPSGTVEIGI